jgi:BirA family transcriptional regulator, biotin operon repressor / biotin---[acetyl-CoA-carboxylase] ligase
MTSSRHRIIHVAETGSTNADAMRLALSGEALPLWVAAERQTAGRGRAGRSWGSLPGNLQASLAIATAAPLQRAGELSLLAGIAAVDAVRAISPLADTAGLRLKWPNDLLLGPAKAGGILVETTAHAGRPLVTVSGFLAVLGFGLNVTAYPYDLGRAATSLAHKGIATSAAELLAALADSCDAWLARWDEGRAFDTIRQAWMERAGPLGEPITVQSPSGTITATYQGLASSGALLAGIDGRIETITYGDVALIAPTHKDKAQ